MQHIACLHPTIGKNCSCTFPNFDLRNDRSEHAKRSSLRNILDSLKSTDWPLPGTTRSLTAMLLCMIAPGLDSGITVGNILFSVLFPLEASLIDFAIDASELARNPFDKGSFTNCWNFWCKPRWPAVRGLLLCVPSRCLRVTKLQYVTSAYCIRVSDCTLQMPSINSHCSKPCSVFSVQTKLGFGLAPRMPRATSELKNSMAPWTRYDSVDTTVYI